MSINTQIQRIKNNINAAYSAIDSKGGIVPTEKISDNLASAINTISTGGGSRFISISDSETVKHDANQEFVAFDAGNESPIIEAISIEQGLPPTESLDLDISSGCVFSISKVKRNTNSDISSCSLSTATPSITCISVEVS